MSQKTNIYMQIWHHYCIHFFLGGVSSCGDHAIKNEYHLRKGNQNVDVTLCGNPPPNLYYTFNGERKNAARVEDVDDNQKMFKYRMQFKNLTAHHCGEKIYLEGEGFKKYESTSTIMLQCKLIADHSL